MRARPRSIFAYVSEWQQRDPLAAEKRDAAAFASQPSAGGSMGCVVS